MKNNLILTSLLFFSLLAISCKKVQDPEFRRIEAFKVKSLGLQQTDIGFAVVYYNPNNFGVTVKEAEAEVFIDSVSMGIFRQDTTVSVGKNAEFSIPLTGGVTFQQIRKLNIETLPFREVLVRANGNVKVGKAGIFISKPFNYEGKHKLSIKL
jgi:LEA14-like dessication related protein